MKFSKIEKTDIEFTQADIEKEKKIAQAKEAEARANLSKEELAIFADDIWQEAQFHFSFCTHKYTKITDNGALHCLICNSIQG